MNFNEEIYWHDSVIKNIKIDRNEPGKKDTIEFEIDWYDKGAGKLLFEDVYWVEMNLNFGIVAKESIDFAFIDVSGDNLNPFYKRWGGLLNDIKLFCYIIKTNSTGSEIKIIAKSFSVIYQ